MRFRHLSLISPFAALASASCIESSTPQPIAGAYFDDISTLINSFSWLNNAVSQWVPSHDPSANHISSCFDAMTPPLAYVSMDADEQSNVEPADIVNHIQMFAALTSQVAMFLAGISQRANDFSSNNLLSAIQEDIWALGDLFANYERVLFTQIFVNAPCDQITSLISIQNGLTNDFSTAVAVFDATYEILQFPVPSSDCLSYCVASSSPSSAAPSSTDAVPISSTLSTQSPPCKILPPSNPTTGGFFSTISYAARPLTELSGALRAWTSVDDYRIGSSIYLEFIAAYNYAQDVNAAVRQLSTMAPEDVANYATAYETYAWDLQGAVYGLQSKYSWLVSQRLTDLVSTDLASLVIPVSSWQSNLFNLVPADAPCFPVGLMATMAQGVSDAFKNAGIKFAISNLPTLPTVAYSRCTTYCASTTSATMATATPGGLPSSIALASTTAGPSTLAAESPALDLSSTTAASSSYTDGELPGMGSDLTSPTLSGTLSADQTTQTSFTNVPETSSSSSDNSPPKTNTTPNTETTSSTEAASPETSQTPIFTTFEPTEGIKTATTGTNIAENSNTASPTTAATPAESSIAPAEAAAKTAASAALSLQNAILTASNAAQLTSAFQNLEDGLNSVILAMSALDSTEVFAAIQEFGSFAASLATALQSLTDRASVLSKREQSVRAFADVGENIEIMASQVVRYESLLFSNLSGDTPCSQLVIAASNAKVLNDGFILAAQAYSVEIPGFPLPPICPNSVSGLSNTAMPTGNSTMTLPQFSTLSTSSSLSPLPQTDRIESHPSASSLFSPLPRTDTAESFPATRVSTLTTVVTEFTTCLTGSTTLCTNGACFTATGPTTLTVTDCPCTFTAVRTDLVTYCATPTTFTYEGTTYTVSSASTITLPGSVPETELRAQSSSATAEAKSSNMHFAGGTTEPADSERLRATDNTVQAASSMGRSAGVEETRANTGSGVPFLAASVSVISGTEAAPVAASNSASTKKLCTLVLLVAIAGLI